MFSIAVLRQWKVIALLKSGLKSVMQLFAVNLRAPKTVIWACLGRCKGPAVLVTCTERLFVLLYFMHMLSLFSMGSSASPEGCRKLSLTIWQIHHFNIDPPMCTLTWFLKGIEDGTVMGVLRQNTPVINQENNYNPKYNPVEFVESQKDSKRH